MTTARGVQQLDRSVASRRWFVPAATAVGEAVYWQAGPGLCREPWLRCDPGWLYATGGGGEVTLLVFHSHHTVLLPVVAR